MLDNVELVHMNGRIYDPMIGRFASADPITEAPASSQGWNRYSYVGNSTVNFTDPSGYCFMGCFWNKAFRGLGALIKKYPIIGSIIKIAASAICVALVGPGCGPIMAFITSAFVTGVTGGSLGQALKSGLIAAATAVAFNIAGGIAGGLDGGAVLAKGGFGAGFGTAAHIFKIASHAAIGCLSAMAGGGKCGAGALSAGVSAGATPFYDTGSTAGNVAAAALIGGTASKLGGGSFADGAATAAFGYLFNQMAQTPRPVMQDTGQNSLEMGVYILRAGPGTNIQSFQVPTDYDVIDAYNHPEGIRRGPGGDLENNQLQRTGDLRGATGYFAPGPATATDTGTGQVLRFPDGAIMYRYSSPLGPTTSGPQRYRGF